MRDASASRDPVAINICFKLGAEFPVDRQDGVRTIRVIDLDDAGRAQRGGEVRGDDGNGVRRQMFLQSLSPVLFEIITVAGRGVACHSPKGRAA